MSDTWKYQFVYGILSEETTRFHATSRKLDTTHVSAAKTVFSPKSAIFSCFADERVSRKAIKGNVLAGHPSKMASIAAAMFNLSDGAKALWNPDPLVSLIVLKYWVLTIYMKHPEIPVGELNGTHHSIGNTSEIMGFWSK